MMILIATPLFPPDSGGPATYSKILVDELPKRGIDVGVLSFGSVRSLPKVIRHLVYFFKVFWQGRKASVIFAQDPVSVGFPSALASLILRKPLVLKVVGDYAWEQGVNRFGVKELLDEFLNKKYGFWVEFLRRIEKFVANRSRAIIVPSRYLKSVLEKWRVKPEKIKVIYNSVNLPKDSTRTVFGERTVLVSIGRLVPWKGFEMLIEIMPEILKKYPDAKLFIIGSGPESEALKLQATSYKLQANVKLLGSLPHEQVLKYLQAADVFLLNTGYEGFSHQILEAMAVGAPVVSTPAGGNKEILKDRENSLVVEYNNKNQWLSAISELLDNPDFARKLAENAKDEIHKFYGQDMIDKTLQVLKEVT